MANHCQRNDYDLSFGSKDELFLWLTSKTQCLVFFKKPRLLQVMRKTPSPQEGEGDEGKDKCP